VLFGKELDRLLSETTLIFAHRDDGAYATENLLYLVRYYCDFFAPFIEIVIVEQGAQPSVNPASLPKNCKYTFVFDGGPFNREQCFNAGISKSNPRNRFLILSDSDIYLETLDFRANLRMCERYGGATGFAETVDLTYDESYRLRSTNTTRGLEITTSDLRVRNKCPGCCCFVSRDAIQKLGESSKTGSKNIDRFSMKDTLRQLGAFQSPNQALRLSS
jgi:hypothetical protein